jgi:hypothetical protein
VIVHLTLPFVVVWSMGLRQTTVAEESNRLFGYEFFGDVEDRHPVELIHRVLWNLGMLRSAKCFPRSESAITLKLDLFLGDTTRESVLFRAIARNEGVKTEDSR